MLMTALLLHLLLFCPFLAPSSHGHHCHQVPGTHQAWMDLAPTVSTPRGLPGPSTTVQMQLYWNGLEVQSSGSEGTIDGMAHIYKLHVRIVLYNSANYSSFEEAEEEPQGLVVLAYLSTDKDVENISYSEFIFSLAGITGQPTTLSSLVVQAVLRGKLLHSYGYQGSLRRLPSSGSAVWSSFHSACVLAHTRVQLLKNALLERHSLALSKDYWHLQPLQEAVLEGSSRAHRAQGTKSSTLPASYFPVEHTESFVEVHPLRAVSLQALTRCLWSRAQPVGSQPILSHPSAHELVVPVGSELGLWVGGHLLSFPLQRVARGWLHHCTTWAPRQGTAELWLSRAAGRAKSTQKGYVSQAGATLGKDRDTLLGTSSRGFAGWVAQGCLWSRAPSATEVRFALCRAGQPQGDATAWGHSPMALLGG